MSQEDRHALVQLRSLSSENRKNVTGLVNQFSSSSSADPFTYSLQNQVITAKNEISAGGETVIVQIPAMGALISELYLRVSLPACTTGTYNPRAALHLFQTIRIRHGSLICEYEPHVVLGAQFSRCTEAETKARLCAFFGNPVAAAGAQEILMPILLPHSCFFTREINEPIKFDKRGILRCDVLKQNLSIECILAPLQSGYASADAVCGSNPRLDLVFQELICSAATTAKLKTRLPTVFLGQEYVALRGNSAAANTWVNVEVGAQLARSPTCNIWVRARPSAYDAKDPWFHTADCLTQYKVNIDGRQVISTENTPQITKDFDQFLLGDPGARGSSPAWQLINFENSPYDKKHYSGQLSNTAANSCTLSLYFNIACDYELYFEQNRIYAFVDGSISVSNAY